MVIDYPFYSANVERSVARGEALIVARLAALEVPSLAPGDAAPLFEGPTPSGPFRLADHADRWIVLYFYPRDFTRGCTQEACGFRDAGGPLARLGALVVGVSRDPPGRHARFAQEKGLAYPLVSDEDAAITRAYGARAWHGFPRRMTFLIRPGGRIAKVYRRVRARRHAEQVLQDLGVLQGNVGTETEN